MQNMFFLRRETEGDLLSLALFSFRFAQIHARFTRDSRPNAPKSHKHKRVYVGGRLSKNYKLFFLWRSRADARSLMLAILVNAS